MADIQLPEPDRTQGAPHPRETQRLFGQETAEQAFLSAFNQGRLHHAWMLTGPKGIGKATLAWKIARFLLAQEGQQTQGGMFDDKPHSLETDPASDLARRMRGLAEPRLFLLRRSANDKETALSQFITVDETRKLKNFFALSAADGGYRVAIIDCLDEMNIASANALLKLLEEPPPRAIFLLISHQPAKLLPTIRSRCRELRLNGLEPQALGDALTQAGGDLDPEDHDPMAELSAGSVGEAFRLTNLDGLELYREITALMGSLPRLNRPRALALAEAAAQKGNEEQFDLTLSLIELFLTRLSRAAATRLTPPEAAPHEAAIFARLAPYAASSLIWAELAQSLTQRARRAKAVNLDPAALVMDILLKIEATAASVTAG